MPRFDTLNAAWMVWDGPAPAPEGVVLEQTRELDKFLAEIERRAFRMAQVALRDPDDAMDVVQDAMLKLARNYATRPSAEWRPLVLSHPGKWHPGSAAPAQRAQALHDVAAGPEGGSGQRGAGSARQRRGHGARGARAADAGSGDAEARGRRLRELPARQREAFMLRNFEGLDVAETASAMGCSRGQRQDALLARGAHAARTTGRGLVMSEDTLNRRPLEERSRALFERQRRRPGHGARARGSRRRATPRSMPPAARGRRAWVLRMPLWTPAAGVDRRGGARRGAVVRRPRAITARRRTCQSNFEDLDIVASSEEGSGDAMEMLQDDIDFYGWADKAAGSEPAA